MNEGNLAAAGRDGKPEPVENRMASTVRGAKEHRKRFAGILRHGTAIMNNGRIDEPTKGGISTSHFFHGGLRRVTRLFGGNYLKTGSSEPVPCESWALDTEGATITGLQWGGGGVPLLLLHGLGNNAWSWARVAGLLRGRRRIIAMSSRGHGLSSAPRSGYSLEQTARDTVAVIEQLAGGSVHLGGHSWGGKIAWYLAASRPELVRSLMLADPVPPAGLNRVLRSMPMLVEASMRAERGPFRSRARWQEAGPKVAFLQRWDAIDQRIWQESFEEQADGSWHHRLPEPAFEEILRGPIAQDISTLAKAVSCPVLLMRPTFTLSFLPSESKQMTNGVALHHDVRIRGDHTFIHTNPIDAAKAMDDFVARYADAPEAQGACGEARNEPEPT